MLAALVILFLASQSFAATIAVSVKGKVSDETGAGLPGVTVTEKGTTNGVATNVDGDYTLSVANAQSVLVFSFVGYADQEVVVGNQSTINVSMVPDAANLDEVVVVGYGTQKKSQLTGAISTVKAQDISDLPITNTQQALQGRVAGVDVMQAGSRPGSEPRVLVRGRRSFSASNNPLYVLDGIPLASGIGDINPNDIESMEVLKDASATAIYGSRGANGVVLITTKRGKAGKGTVSYDAYYGISKAHNTIQLMNGEQFAEAKREAYRTSGNYIDDASLFSAVELEGLATGRSTDYLNGLLRNGNIQNHQIGFSGGNESTRFNMSLNYFKDNGVIPNQDFNRNVLRINLDHKINKIFTVGMSTFINYSILNGESFNPLGGALRENPLGQTYNEDGSLNFLPTEDGLRSNPFSEIVPGAIVDRKRSNRSFSGLYATANIAKGLTYRVNFGPDFTIEKDDRFQGTFTNARRLAPPAAQTDNYTRFNYALENILNYEKSFGGKHTLNFTGVQSLQKDRVERNGISVSGIPSEKQQFNNFGNASIIEGVSSSIVESTLLSYLGRVNYGFNDKYLITLSMRADGSSVFGANTKWGYFPAAALAWNMSNENFIKSVSAIDLMKLRVSYGAIGNQGINPYQTQGLLSQRAYNFGSSAEFGYAPNTIGNPDLRWETSTTLNAGLDFSLFRGRISGSLEGYTVNTTDLLLSRNLPESTGFSNVTTNIGQTRNSGFEATVSTINVARNNGFKWATDFTFFTNKEEIVELYNGPVDDIGNGWFIGKPLSVIYDYQKIGIWQSNEEDLAKSYGFAVGENKILDANEDGVINSEDRVFQGSGVPDFSGGITNRLSYKGLDLSFFVFARVGQTIRSNFHSSNNSLFGRYNNILVDYWTPTNPTNDFPRPNENQESPRFSSSMAIFDGSFVKVRNINLGYQVPSEVASKLGMQSLRIYSSIQQPFIFSSFISRWGGIDPETDIDAQLSGNVTPSTWTSTIGINVKF